jgi:succinate dehydrogenase/fumarate reductase flavoprotein subunit
VPGRAVGVTGLNIRTGEFVVVRAPGLYAAGDMASVPHNYMLEAFVFGNICARNAVEYVRRVNFGNLNDGFIESEWHRVFAPLQRPNGVPWQQFEYKLFEYKLRRQVNDYLQPPKNANRLNRELAYFIRAIEEIDQLGATEPHDLMRTVECSFIRDCAEMAVRASLFREESRWGLYHYRQDFSEKDDEHWFAHVNLRKGSDGEMTLFKRPVDPYVVPLDEAEVTGYRRIRIQPDPVTAEIR